MHIFIINFMHNMPKTSLLKFISRAGDFNKETYIS